MFYDIQPRATYAQFIRETERVKPYRSADGLKRYPLGRRAYSRRYWKFVDEDEQKENPPIGIFYDDVLLLKYHSDDSVEFVATFNSYGQGDAALVSTLLNGRLKSVASLGGAVYYTKHFRHNGMYPIMHPAFVGLRVNLNDGTAHKSCQYEVRTRKVIASRTKPFRDEYTKAFSLATKLLKVMDKDQIYEEMMEQRSTFMPTLPGSSGEKVKAWQDYWEKSMESVAQEFLQNQDVVGFVLHFGARYNYKDFPTWKRWSMHTYNDESPVLIEKSFPETIKARFLDELYRSLISKGADICDIQITFPGIKLPTVKWGQDIIVNGNEAVRYS